MTRLEFCTDLELVSLINNEELAAFDEVYHRYWQALYRSAFNILKDQDEVMDIVQEVFIWVWEHRGNLVLTSLKGYLHSAIKYKVANYIRQGKIRQSFFDEIQLADYSNYTTDENLEMKELKGIIASFTASLPERSREIFTLSREEYLSNKEIAARLSISEKTVENQMTIILKKLRLSLGRMSCWMFFFL